MKSNHVKFAKDRDIAVGDSVLACDHLLYDGSGKLVLSYSKHHLLPFKSS